MTTSRRHFLITAGAVTAGFGGLAAAIARGAHFVADEPTAEGYGLLQRDSRNMLDLPNGFSYRTLSRIGERMDDGLLVPGDHDGMAAFPGPGGKTILVRNHELFVTEVAKSAFGPKQEHLDKMPPERLYDPGHKPKSLCIGGTTTIVYDTKLKQLDRHFMSLAGTVNNCAGGPTPWNSWLSCEETTARADEGFTKDHGYVFEVPADPDSGPVEPRPIKPMGRFRHEAVCVDPKTGVVYLTEDTPDGLIYRYLPDKPGDLHAGGKLQALAVRGRKALDTRNWGFFREVGLGSKLPCEWIDLDDVDSPNNDLRLQGAERGAAIFARGEGMWFGRNTVFFACTKGGWQQAGQIWKYTPSPGEGSEREKSEPGVLELFIEPNDHGLIDMADNVTVAPWGDLVICEDGSDTQYLVGATPEGKLYKLARNAKGVSEFAGATFSPDGSTLFVNMQYDGLTFAITGPWDRRRA